MQTWRMENTIYQKKPNDMPKNPFTTTEPKELVWLQTSRPAIPVDGIDDDDIRRAAKR